MTRTDSEHAKATHGDYSIRLDVHAHLIPIRPEHVQGLEGVSWSVNDRLVIDGNELPKRELYEPAALIRWMDEHHVRHAWVSVPPTLYRTALGPDAALRWTGAINEGLRSVTCATGERLEALLHLPIQHPSVATEVADRAMSSGHRRFAMPAGDAQRGRMLSDPDYEPLWSVLDRARAFVFVHPGRGCDARLERLSLSNLLGSPVETAVAAAHLAMSGTLERHSNITFCLAHGGGATAAVAGRMQRGQDTGRPGAYVGGERVAAALRRFCVDCITHDVAALDLAAATYGDDRVLFGSDWPFDMGLRSPHDELRTVRQDLLRRIFVENANRLLGDSALAQDESR